MQRILVVDDEDGIAIFCGNTWNLRALPVSKPPTAKRPSR